MTKKVLYDTASDLGMAKVLPEPPAYVPCPRWQEFPGFSFIFENPLSTLERHDNYELLRIGEDQLKEIDLYRRVDEALNSIDPVMLTQRFLFFSLPSSTYHVTVWDGVNKGNMDRLEPDSKRQFEEYFANGIEGAAGHWPPFNEYADYSHVFDGLDRIRLRYRGLRARGSTVLVVELEADPDDQTSINVLKEIQYRRKRLDEMFAAYGKPENYTLRPHVAIGYFADSNLGSSALFQYMDTWMAEFDRILKGASVEFSDIGLYAFMDMVTYFRSVSA